MALVQATLKSAIKAAFDNVSDDPNVDPSTARDQIANDLATAILNFVKSADVTTTVTGSSASGGPVTGAGAGSLS